jgi:glycosyltransferase involved in cell wall biosynthesis
VTIIEAMGLSKAIIATNVGGVAELIQSQVNGLVVQSEDDKAIAVCLMRLFYDANYCQQLGQQARQTFQQRLTLDKFGQNVIEVIREILPVNNSGI